MNLYCISVLTGYEEKYIESVNNYLTPKGELDGSLHFLKKQMRLKTGKEYEDSFFPGYVFLETNESNSAKIHSLSNGKYFLRFLPSTQNITPLSIKDIEIIKTILHFGNPVKILQVTFDKGDHIIIKDGPFKDFNGKVKSVNRRNKRINIEIDFLGSIREISLSYEVVEKVV